MIQQGRPASGGDSPRSCSGRCKAGPGGRPAREEAANLMRADYNGMFRVYLKTAITIMVD